MKAKNSRSAAAQQSAADFIPSGASLPALRQAVQACRGCDLYRFATQAVFGEGPRGVELMLVGHSPWQYRREVPSGEFFFSHATPGRADGLGMGRNSVSYRSSRFRAPESRS